MTLLSVEELTIDVPSGRAVDGVSFTLSPGQVFGLLGESGAGKSLTGAAVIGLLPKAARMTGGRVMLDGERIDDQDEDSWEELRGTRLTAVFQDPVAALDPLQSVGAHLSETLRARYPLTDKVGRERVGDWLSAVGIPLDRAGAFPHELSGGMCQRVAIALALCTGPEVLVADEPTTALDVTQRAHIALLLRRLASRQGTAVLLISHDLRTVAAAADSVGVMYAGRLVEAGAAGDVLRAPAHPYTAGLLASLPSVTKRARRQPSIDGVMPPLNELPPGCAFHPRCARAVARCRTERPVLTHGVACWRPLVAAGGPDG